jgi:phage anti-repressor protein
MTTPIQPDQYETWEAMILSDQVPADELAQLLEANPDFAEWYRRRAEARKSPKES